MNTIYDYDVIIIGAGIVGLTQACLLADSSLKVAIVEGKQPNFDFSQIPYDNRVSAITRASQQILRQCQVWNDIAAMRISPYRSMSVWDGSGHGAIEFSSNDIGETDLGHIIENRVMRKALITKLQTHDNVAWICPANVENVQTHDDCISIALQDGRCYSAALIIGADGARSWLREKVGFEVKTWDYGHHAIVATVKSEKSHQQTARQRFMPNGPLAFLPLSDEYTCSIVWATIPTEAEALMQLNEKAFAERLTQAFDQHLGKVLSAQSRASFPLIMRHAKKYLQHRIALIGDAAHTIHPLAGQGLNLGMMDAACLAKIIKQNKSNNQDIGLVSNMRAFERERKSENSKMIAAMEGFKRLFCNDKTLLKTVRNIGLNMTNQLPIVKRKFIREAMGL